MQDSSHRVLDKMTQAIWPISLPLVWSSRHLLLLEALAIVLRSLDHQMCPEGMRASETSTKLTESVFTLLLECVLGAYILLQMRSRG